MYICITVVMETYHIIGEKLSVKCQFRLKLFQLLNKKKITTTIQQPIKHLTRCMGVSKEQSCL